MFGSSSDISRDFGEIKDTLRSFAEANLRPGPNLPGVQKGRIVNGRFQKLSYDATYQWLPTFLFKGVQQTTNLALWESADNTAKDITAVKTNLVKKIETYVQKLNNKEAPPNPGMIRDLKKEITNLQAIALCAFDQLSALPGAYSGEEKKTLNTTAESFTKDIQETINKLNQAIKKEYQDVDVLVGGERIPAKILKYLIYAERLRYADNPKPVYDLSHLTGPHLRDAVRIVFESMEREGIHLDKFKPEEKFQVLTAIIDVAYGLHEMPHAPSGLVLTVRTVLEEAHRQLFPLTTQDQDKKTLMNIVDKLSRGINVGRYEQFFTEYAQTLFQHLAPVATEVRSEQDRLIAFAHRRSFDDILKMAITFVLQNHPIKIDNPYFDGILKNPEAVVKALPNYHSNQENKTFVEIVHETIKKLCMYHVCCRLDLHKEKDQYLFVTPQGAKYKLCSVSQDGTINIAGYWEIMRLSQKIGKIQEPYDGVKHFSSIAEIQSYFLGITEAKQPYILMTEAELKDNPKVKDN